MSSMTQAQFDRNRDMAALEVGRMLAAQFYSDATRLDRAVRLYTSEMVDLEAGTVQSDGQAGRVYQVTCSSCTCPDHQQREVVCKHIMAIVLAKTVRMLLPLQYHGSLDGDPTRTMLVTVYRDKTNVLHYYCQTPRCPEPRELPAERVVLGARLDLWQAA